MVVLMSILAVVSIVFVAVYRVTIAMDWINERRKKKLFERSHIETFDGWCVVSIESVTAGGYWVRSSRQSYQWFEFDDYDTAMIFLRLVQKRHPSAKLIKAL